MQVIPVIDLKGGQVVRGIGGRRDDIDQSAACSPPSCVPRLSPPRSQAAGFREVYVADLDAIGGAEPAWSTYAELTDAGSRTLGRRGSGNARSAPRAGRVASRRPRPPRSSPGSNRSPDPKCFRNCGDSWGPQRLVFSLDLKNGAPLVARRRVARTHSWQIAMLGAALRVCGG